MPGGYRSTGRWAVALARHYGSEVVLGHAIPPEVRGFVPMDELPKELDRDLVLETIVFRMPFENYEKVFDTLIRWGRYGDLLGYDDTTDHVWLPQEKQTV